MRGLRRRLAGVLAIVLPLSAVVALTPPAAQAAATYPSVVITSPTDGSTVGGAVQIDFSGAVDPNGSDAINGFVLVVNGSEWGPPTQCPAADIKGCTGELTWQAQARTTANVQVEMVTEDNDRIYSSVVVLTVQHPAAAVVIDNLADGDVVSGPDVVIDADAGFLDPAADDQVGDFDLFVDGVGEEYLTCDRLADASACSVEFGWDTTRTSAGQHTLVAEFTTASGGVWDSDPLTVDVRPWVVPTVSITSPVAGAQVSGQVSVTALGSVPGSTGDVPEEMALFVDGGMVGDPLPCPSDSLTCRLTFGWDAGKVHAGTHTLTVGFATADTVVLSDGVPVTVAEVAPTVSLALPGDPVTVVTGTVTVTVNGTVGATAASQPVRVHLSVNGQPWGPTANCPVAQLVTTRTCSVSIPWDTSNLPYGRPATISATLTTADTSVFTPARTVTVGSDYSAPGSVVLRLNGLQAGKSTVEVFGRASDKSGQGVGGAVVTLAVTPLVGPPYTLSVTTDSLGTYQTDLRGTGAATVVASLSAQFGSSSSSWSWRPTLHVICHVPARITHGRKTAITCSGPAADGTKATLYLKYPHAGAHVLTHARFHKGKVTITEVSKLRKEKAQLWVVVDGTRAYNGVATQPVLVSFI